MLSERPKIKASEVYRRYEEWLRIEKKKEKYDAYLKDAKAIFNITDKSLKESLGQRLAGTKSRVFYATEFNIFLTHEGLLELGIDNDLKPDRLDKDDIHPIIHEYVSESELSEGYKKLVESVIGRLIVHSQKEGFELLSFVKQSAASSFNQKQLLSNYRHFARWYQEKQKTGPVPENVIAGMLYDKIELPSLTELQLDQFYNVELKEMIILKLLFEANLKIQDIPNLKMMDIKETSVLVGSIEYPLTERVNNLLKKYIKTISLRPKELLFPYYTKADLTLMMARSKRAIGHGDTNVENLRDMIQNSYKE